MIILPDENSIKASVLLRNIAEKSIEEGLQYLRNNPKTTMLATVLKPFTPLALKTVYSMSDKEAYGFIQFLTQFCKNLTQYLEEKVVE